MQADRSEAEAEVVGVDISLETLRVAESLIKKCKVERNASVCQMVAEDLKFKDETFDLVYGCGVLHHVGVDQTSRELTRVLKPGGKAIFIELLSYNPLIKLYRYFVGSPNRIPVEIPFNFNHINRMKKYFHKVTHRKFQLFTLSIFLYFFFIKRSDPRKEKYWRKLMYEGHEYNSILSRLQGIDDFVLEEFPFLGRFCWYTVITLEKKR